MRTEHFLKSVLSMLSVNLPYLCGLAHKVEIHFSDEVETMGVFASGRLLICEDWFIELSMEDAMFVFAHELLHLLFKTHERAGEDDHPRLVNWAHDLVINDYLCRELGLDEVPAGGLDVRKEFPNLDKRDICLENVYLQLKGNKKKKKYISQWKKPGTAKQEKEKSAEPNQMELALRKALGRPLEKDKSETVLNKKKTFPKTDILSRKTEERLFGEKAEQVLNKTEMEREIHDAICLKSAAENYIKGYMKNTEYSAELLNSVRTSYIPPWELAVQQWMEYSTVGVRSYSRPSRRSFGSEIILPGRIRNGKTIHIVLDTSESMTDSISKLLGIISSFAEAMQIESLHLVQCDDEVKSDEWLTPDQLASYEVKGYGGSDMGPAMLYLMDDPAVESVLVITDGAIYYPESEPPYQVLWALTEKNYDFQPPYGMVVEIKG